MKNIDTNILIIGAGASGITAAISAAHSRKNKNITLIEKNDRIGKKILVTGNGKCNLSNEKIEKTSYNESAHVIEPILLKYNSGFVRDFFEKMGLLTRADGVGRVYPYTNQASSVLDTLRLELEKCSVRAFTDVDVTSITKKNGRFIVVAGDLCFAADKLIISVGGLASPGKVFADKIYTLVEQLGHTFAEPFPALVPVRTNSGFEKSLKGLRWNSRIALCAGDRKVQEETGEVQFTDYGLSGICVFQLSRAVTQLQRAKVGNLKIFVDLMPEYEVLEIFKLLKKKIELQNDLFTGVLNGRIGQAVLNQCGKTIAQAKLENLSDEQMSKIAKTVKSLEFKVQGVQSFRQAQVMSGGVKLSEIDLTTMESLRVKGLYLAGEMLNVDGLCGGFNLHWAWVSGYIAGKNAAEE